ncbi:hypothetical protein ACQP1P_33095 [Dactylosporangium sp. CA-052675]|uniref:hypothetical protein n=1 Tax=Dactylosporangium sp. CA-052675 TaxID=3239927 RepID=UPI003D9114A5
MLRTIERLRSRRPNLPEELSTEQLEAWIELADIVQDDQFRTALRDYLHRIFSTEQGKRMTSPQMTAHAERHRQLFLEARAAALISGRIGRASIAAVQRRVPVGLPVGNVCSAVSRATGRPGGRATRRRR